MVQRKLWTPSGDVPVGGGGPTPPSGAPSAPPGAAASSGDATIGGQRARDFDSPDGGDRAEMTPEQAEMLAAIEQLQRTPVVEIVLNQAVSLYQLATLHVQTGSLDEARLAASVLCASLDAAAPALAATEDGAAAALELRLNGRYLEAVANLEPGRPAEAKAAIDGLAAFVDAERDTLGPAADKLDEELVTLRLAYAERFGGASD
jgi:hypothetical protein